MPIDRAAAIGGGAAPTRRAGRLRWGFLSLAAGLVGAPSPVPAQGLNPLAATTDSRPIDITADTGIEWQQDKKIYVARGNAVATRGASEVHADTLTAHYRESKTKTGEGGSSEVYRLDADGHVLIKGPNQTVIGDQAVYDVDQQIGLVTGKHLKLTTPTDVVTARDSLEWYDQQQVAVARGDALAIRGDRRIRADVLTAHFVKDKAPNGAAPDAKSAAGKTAATGSATAKTAVAQPAPAVAQPAPAPAKPPPAPAKPGAASAKPGGPGAADNGEANSRISRVDAQGHVIVTTTTDIGRGDYGVYNADTGIVTLLGNVTITRGQDAVRGQYAVVDLNTNISRIMTLAAKPGAPAPRVEGLFYRQDSTAQGNSPPKPAAKSGIASPKS